MNSVSELQTLKMCPVCIIERDGCIPAHVVPIPADLSRYGAGHLEEVETFGGLLARLGALDEYGIDPESIVLAVKQKKNTWCGGAVRYWVGIANQRVHRLFGEFCTGVYIAERDDGRLFVAIPA